MSHVDPKSRRMSLANVTDEPDSGTQATVVHGPPGVGKTTFVSDASDVVFICSEQGLKGAGQRKVAHFPHPTSLRDVHDALDELLVGKHAFRHLAIDSIDWVETMIHEQVCAENDVPYMEGKDFKKLYSAAMPHADRLLKKLDLLRARRRMHVWLIAHSTQIKVANIRGETWDKWDLKLDRRFAERVREWADNVLFAGFVTDVVKGGRGMRTIGRIRGRLLFTVESADHFAKNRNGLPETLPLDFEALRGALNAGRPAPDAQLRARIDTLLTELRPADRASIRESLASYQLDNPRRLALILSKAESLCEIARAEEDDVSHDRDVGDDDAGGDLAERDALEDTQRPVELAETDQAAPRDAAPALAPTPAQPLAAQDHAWDALSRTALQRIADATSREQIDEVLREVSRVGFPAEHLAGVREAAFAWRIDHELEVASLETLAGDIKAARFADGPRRRLLGEVQRSASARSRRSLQTRRRRREPSPLHWLARRARAALPLLGAARRRAPASRHEHRGRPRLGPARARGG